VPSTLVVWGQGLLQPIFDSCLTDTWPAIEGLRISRHVLDAKSVLQLVNAIWPYLESLDVSHTSLDAAAVCHLSQGDWPQLDSLCLSYNHVCAGGVQYLPAGNWPVLASLSLIDSGLEIQEPMPPHGVGP